MNKKMFTVITLILAGIVFITSCGSASPSSAEEPTPTEAPTEAPPEEPTPTENPFALKTEGPTIEDLIYTEDDFDKHRTYASKFDTDIKNGKLSPKWNDYNYDPLCFWMSENGDERDFFIFGRYHAENWLFVNSIEIKIGDDIFSRLPEGMSTDIDDNAYITESFLIYIDDELLEALDTVDATTSVTVRFSGDKGNFTFDLPSIKKMAIKQMVDVWKDAR